MQTYIAGIPHRKPDLSKLSVGDEVLLRAEPDNRFDLNAIRVSFAGEHLGYIPRKETGIWKNIPSAKIVEIQPSRKWTEVQIEA